MNNLIEYWQRFKSFARDLLQQIEESSFYERILSKFESLEPRQQKMIKTGGIYLSLLAIALVYLLPVMGVISQKNHLADTRKLLGELQSFNNENSIVRSPAPRPQGWTPFVAQNLKDMESEISQYAESMGIPADFINSSSSGINIQLELKELSLRQALTLMYKMDGQHPSLAFESLKMTVHPQFKDLLELKMRARFDGTQMVSAPDQESGLSGGFRNSGSPAQENEDSSVSSPSSGGNSRPNFDDDFNEGPPPLNYEEDI